MRIRSIAKFIATAIISTALAFAPAQQPQSQLAPISAVNAKYANGVAPGYAPTINSGLVLNVSAGTSICFGVVQQYSGGTLTLSPSTTNYIYLNTSSSCVPATKTSTFTIADVPIATVTTSGSAITAISDDRTPLNYGGYLTPTGNGSGLTNLNATALTTGTVADGRLSTNVPLLNIANSFSKGIAAATFSSHNAITFTSSSYACASGYKCDAFSGTIAVPVTTGEFFAGVNWLTWNTPPASIPNCTVSQTGRNVIAFDATASTTGLLFSSEGTATSSATIAVTYICGGGN